MGSSSSKKKNRCGLKSSADSKAIPSRVSKDSCLVKNDEVVTDVTDILKLNGDPTTKSVPDSILPDTFVLSLIVNDDVFNDSMC